MYEENYRLLVDAIVVQAAKDYRKAKSRQEKNELRKFFLSDWFKDLTDTDCQRILNKLDSEISERRCAHNDI